MTNLEQPIIFIISIRNMCLTASQDYRKIKHGNAGPLGTYDILSMMTYKFARFLFEFQSVRFESLDLPILPDDRSDFDVHCAIKDDKVKQLKYTCLI
jgi:hypothetical protein